MRCTNCNNELRKGSKFCTKCGAIVSDIYLEQQNANHQKTSLKWAWAALGGTIVLIIIIICAFVHITFLRDSNNIPIAETSSNLPNIEPSTVNNIDYSLEHLSKAIRVLENYKNYGAPCDFSDEWVYPEAWEFLNESQIQRINDLKCSDCCCSIIEAEEHLEQFMASHMYEDFSNNNYVEYRGLLYVAIGDWDCSEYHIELTESQVTRISYNEIYVVAEKYDSTGNYCCNTRIDFKYQNGTYKIVQVMDLINN